MGIRHLNKYLLENCSSKSIQKIHLSCLTGKCVVIDTSIYLYKYATEGTLIESMYLLISVLKNYQIVPIFIFDGKPPDEKRELLRIRKHMKLDAAARYKEINEKDNLSEKDLKELEQLKRQFINVSTNDICNVKKLMDLYGVEYHTSPCEADQLCYHFIKTKQVWGCVSDDMDMFIYGCERVLRGISLLNHTVILYKTNSMLRELSVPFSVFQCILILCGTDYNVQSQEQNKIPVLFQYYKKFLAALPGYAAAGAAGELQNNFQDFYQWLTLQNKNNIHLVDLETIHRLQKMFIITEFDKLNNYKLSKENLGVYNLQKLSGFLQNYNFVFL
jgi:flap endonuclease-1